ncbi:hypothetical protein D3C81_1315210 [compost metagenome]
MPIRPRPTAMKSVTSHVTPEPNMGASTRPKMAMATETQIMVARRPRRSASTAENGIVSAKNSTANSCTMRNSLRVKPSLVVPQLSANTVIR